MINTSSSVKPRVVTFHTDCLTIDSKHRISYQGKSHAKPVKPVSGEKQ
jgi:hypothetical protein